ncbi:thioredoxin family protein [Flagellimonas taeanensis]|uniref:thioredoxin family protein n=1 Tax=Flavobacteriaceae TaxID=49546 RepID=UPI000E684F30|nr:MULTISPECIES: thioredoxin family protein [Allomuricauda]MDC6385129.1 thioredoxin family protein [Muricauda sp. SK9]RIV52784.1 thioredoxin family protein [Allomuricauda taeanensis]
MEVIEKDRLSLAEEALSKGKDYQEYRERVHRLAEEGKTTGPEQSEARINFTQLNDQRMRRWEKTFKMPEDVHEKLSKLDSKLVFLVLTESWCGDAAASLPIMDQIARKAKNIELKIVLRDENLELMDAFLTKGSRSIPKLIVLDKNKEQIVGEWGPRPSVATEMVEAFKAAHGKLTDGFKQDLQVWYNKDKGKNILGDILQLLALE